MNMVLQEHRGEHNYFDVWNAPYLLLELRHGVSAALPSAIIESDLLTKPSFNYISNARSTLKIIMNSIFQAVAERIRQDGFSLFEFFENLSPRTPPSVIPMKIFNIDVIRDSILLNIAGQRLRLSEVTTNKIIEYLSGDFSECTKKAAIQVLIHYSKMDVNLLRSRYLKSSDKMTCAQYYDKSLSLFIQRASKQYGEETKVTTLSETSKRDLKNHLLSPPIVEALCTCLNNIVDNACISFEDVQRRIDGMEIYTTKQFGPLGGLRGACLLDGILICTSKLAAFEGTNANKADLITLSVHECSHYIARMFFDNFNFSTPFKYCDVRRLDPVEKEISLELGRSVESLIFDKIQPNWDTSSEEAAEIFLKQLKTSKCLPLINERQHQEIGLSARILSSPPFGIDLEDDDCVFE